MITNDEKLVVVIDEYPYLIEKETDAVCVKLDDMYRK